MRGFNFNITSLFGGNSSSSFFGSFNFSDYSSIKSGSYKKLLKSYYGEQKKTASTDKATQSSTTKATTSKKEKSVDNSGLSQMKKEADGLKKATEVLNNDELWKVKDGEADIDKIASAVKTFANEYNDVITQSGKVNSRDVAQSIHYMSSMTNTMSKSLAKIGITVGTDGKMTVDEDKLKKASVSSIKSMFKGAASYGSQIENWASEISKDAVKSSSMYSSTGALNSTISGMFDKWI